MLLRVPIILSFLFLTLKAAGGEVLVIDNAKKDFFLDGGYYDIIEDKNYSPADILSGKYFFAFDTSRILYGQDKLHPAYWYRFSLKNKLGIEHQLTFELLNFQVDQASLYIPLGNGSYKRYHSGDNFPFDFKKTDHKNFVFPLPEFGSDSVLTCYLWIEVKQKVANRSRAVVRSQDRFISYALKEYYLLGIFYGILFIMLVYNIILFITIRSASYIYYILYILSVAFYSLSWNGLGFQFIWPSYPEFNAYALPFASYFLVIWASLYVKSFLLTSERALGLDRTLIFVILIRSVLFILGLSFLPDLLYQYWIDILPLLAGFIAGIISLKDNFRPARYYVVAYSCLFTGFMILSSVHLGILSPGIFTVYSLEMGVVIELVFFSVALADRYKLLKISENKALELAIEQLKENEKLKDEVNRQLEAKVSERTLELKEANEKLKEQAEKITRMNLMLDLDNRKLEKDVKDLHSARVFLKDVDMAEFNELYPDDESCYKFLSHLKWEDNFKCKKCYNDKFFWGKTPFARRCTRCGYEESVTAHTIFHNMRIPIVKAFQTVFLVYSRKEKITSTELSRVLDLRQKTCWQYKRMISERIQTRKKEDKSGKAGGWDQLILDQD